MTGKDVKLRLGDTYYEWFRDALEIKESLHNKMDNASNEDYSKICKALGYCNDFLELIKRVYSINNLTGIVTKPSYLGDDEIETFVFKFMMTIRRDELDFYLKKQAREICLEISKVLEQLR